MNNNFSDYFFTLPEEINEVNYPDADSDYIFSPQVYFRGATQIPGAQVNLGFQIITKPIFLDRIPHYHNVDEYIIFAGASFPNMFDFDAEIDFTMGEEGTDASVFHITAPTVIRIPAGIKHCPIRFKRVTKPILFSVVLMQDMFSSINEVTGAPMELWYNGPGPCRLNPAKKCEACRNCLQK